MAPLPSVRWPQLVVLIAAILLHLIDSATASAGDRSFAYKSCVASCVSETCYDSTNPQYHVPLHLRLTFWTCPDECGYACMHNLTSLATSDTVSFEEKFQTLPGLPPNQVVQFYGKWPFYRFLGVQEPLSVLFSLANMYMHAVHGLGMRRKLPSDLSAPMKRAYRIVPLAGVNLWVCSVIFHTRDKPWTEKADYFSAALAMICNLYLAVVRLAGLYRTREDKRDAALARLVLASVLGAIYLCHISYLTFWRFDYGYNMVFNVSLGLLHNLLWSSWSLYHYFLPVATGSTISAGLLNKPGIYRARHYARPFLVLTLLSSLMILELFDFPPIWRMLDAHALWHLSTIPVIKMWYDCLLRDAWWVVGREAEYGEGQKMSRNNRKRSRLA